MSGGRVAGPSITQTPLGSELWLIGCGIAGYRDEQIAPLFRPLVAIGRCSFAKQWRPYLFAET